MDPQPNRNASDSAAEMRYRKVLMRVADMSRGALIQGDLSSELKRRNLAHMLMQEMLELLKEVLIWKAP